MSKKTGLVVALLCICAFSVLLVNCGSSSSRPAGVLYVVSQAQSDVSSYAIDLDNGGLSLINETLTATCPAMTNCGLPLNMSVDPKGATAFVMNEFTISGYTVNSDGTLSSPALIAPTSGAGVPEGPMQGMTADAAGDMLFVLSPGILPSASDCSVQVVLDPSCPSISVYSTSPGSTSITLASTKLLNRVPTGLSVLTFTAPGGSSAETLLFMTSNKDLLSPPNDNELSVYLVDSTGTLTEQPNSPYTTPVNPRVVQAVNTNPPGQNVGGVFVYVGNQGPSTGAMSGFQLCTQVQAPCTAQEVQNNQLLALGTDTLANGQFPAVTAVDPTNNFLYVACTGSSLVFGFRMIANTGALSPLIPPSQPTGSSPVALSMLPNFNGGAQLLYTSNNVGNSITGFNIISTTGEMSIGTTVIFPPGSPSGIAGR
jgi:hypothetical protein